MSKSRAEALKNHQHHCYRNRSAAGQTLRKWNLSEKKGNKDSKGYDASNIRNFVYNDGKLYCVYNHSDILVLNAQTGAKLGFLPKNDIVKGGTLTLCDVKCINGKILACNIANKAKNSVYTHGTTTTATPHWHYLPQTSKAPLVWVTVWSLPVHIPRITGWHSATTTAPTPASSNTI